MQPPEILGPDLIRPLLLYGGDGFTHPARGGMAAVGEVDAPEPTILGILTSLQISKRFKLSQTVVQCPVSRIQNIRRSRSAADCRGMRRASCEVVLRVMKTHRRSLNCGCARGAHRPAFRL